MRKLEWRDDPNGREAIAAFYGREFVGHVARKGVAGFTRFRAWNDRLGKTVGWHCDQLSAKVALARDLEERGIFRRQPR